MTIKKNFDMGIEKLKKIAAAQPAAQQEMFYRLLPEMEMLAAYYDTIEDNQNYESYGHEWAANKGMSTNDQRVIVSFTSQAIKMGRDE